MPLVSVIRSNVPGKLSPSSDMKTSGGQGWIAALTCTPSYLHVPSECLARRLCRGAGRHYLEVRAVKNDVRDEWVLHLESGVERDYGDQTVELECWRYRSLLSDDFPSLHLAMRTHFSPAQAERR